MTRRGPHATRGRDGRGTSTTLDVVLFVLLVSAAVGVLAAAAPPADGHDPRTADRAAELLATTTVAVDRPGRSANATPGEGRTSRVHGTLAALLARAAVADAATSVDPERGSGREHGRAAFAAAVAERTRGALSSVDARANATASYAPLPGRQPSGETTVGPAVPAGVDVAVARVRVPVGTGPAPGALRRTAGETGDRALARALADATVATTLPSSWTRWALRDDATAPTVADRYRRLGRSLSTSTIGALDAGRVGRANRLLARALADEYLVAIRADYDSPAAAAAVARPRVVVLTVRTWSP